MKKRGRRFQFSLNLSNKMFYTLILIGILIVGAWIVYAVVPGGSGDPGHNINDIGPPLPCNPNQVLSWDGIRWACVSGMTDTRCDTSGTCSQVCIGSNCMTGWGLKQIKETRRRDGTWPGFNCATASGDTCNGDGSRGSGTCGQPYHCTQADAISGKVCDDVWGYNGWDCIERVSCSTAFVGWAGPSAATEYGCTADSSYGYNGCTGY